MSRITFTRTNCACWYDGKFADREMGIHTGDVYDRIRLALGDFAQRVTLEINETERRELLAEVDSMINPSYGWERLTHPTTKDERNEAAAMRRLHKALKDAKQ